MYPRGMVRTGAIGIALTLLVLLSITAPSIAAVSRPPAPAYTRVKISSLEANTNLATALIATVRGSELVPAGTGFVVQVPLFGRGPIDLLCSAAHVFNGGEEPQVAVFHQRTTDGNNFDFKSIVKIVIAKTGDSFVANRDRDVDLACANITDAGVVDLLQSRHAFGFREPRRALSQPGFAGIFCGISGRPNRSSELHADHAPWFSRWFPAARL